MASIISVAFARSMFPASISETMFFFPCSEIDGSDRYFSIIDGFGAVAGFSSDTVETGISSNGFLRSCPYHGAKAGSAHGAKGVGAETPPIFEESAAAKGFIDLSDVFQVFTELKSKRLNAICTVGYSKFLMSKVLFFPVIRISSLALVGMSTCGAPHAFEVRSMSS